MLSPMAIIRCIPVVGTAVSGIEAVGALVQGDMKKFAVKATQATVGGVLDVVFLASGGVSAILTAPLKVGATEGGKMGAKKAVEKAVEMVAKKAVEKAVEKVATNVMIRGAAEVFVEAAGGNRDTQRAQSSKRSESGSRGRTARSTSNGDGSGSGTNNPQRTAASSGCGSGNDPPRNNRQRQPREHEIDDQSDSSIINELIEQSTMVRGRLSTPEQLLSCLDVIEADTGPASSDTAGHVYLYVRDDANDVGENAKCKVGSTKLKPESRMRDSARANADTYRLVFWVWSPYCRLTEGIVHAMARNSRIPRIQNIERRTIDGGTEWFRDSAQRLQKMIEVAKEYVQGKYGRNTQ